MAVRSKCKQYVINENELYFCLVKQMSKWKKRREKKILD